MLWYLIALPISFPRSGSWFVFSSCRSVELLLDSIFIDFEFPAWICQFMLLVDFEIHLFLVLVKFFFLSVWLSRKQRKRREKKSKFLNSTVKSFVLVPTVSLVILKHIAFSFLLVLILCFLSNQTEHIWFGIFRVWWIRVVKKVVGCEILG